MRHKTLGRTLGLLCVLWLAGPVFASESPLPKQGLEELGIEVELYLTLDASKNLRGGVDTAGEAVRALYGIRAEIDAERLVRWKGGTVYVDAYGFVGDDGSAELVGDLQVFSNIDSDERFQLSEIWIQQELAEGTVRIKIGKMDANGDFAYVEHGLEFIHSSPGFSPTNLVFPTYPETAFGAAVFVEVDSFFAGFALLDGALQAGFRTGSRGPSTLFRSPSDLYLIVEAGGSWERGRAAVGVWFHTGDFDRFGGGVDDGTVGFHLVLDHWISRDEGSEEHGLGLFVQIALADGDVSEVELHVGVGVVRTKVFDREGDAAGIMVSVASLTDDPAAGFVDDTETAVELFYKLEIQPWLVLKPDLQFIANPGGAGGRDAWVFTLRVELVF